MSPQDEEEFEYHKAELTPEWNVVRETIRFNLPRVSCRGPGCCRGARFLGLLWVGSGQLLVCWH